MRKKVGAVIVLFLLLAAGGVYALKSEISESLTISWEKINAETNTERMVGQLVQAARQPDFVSLLEKQGMYPDEVAALMEKLLRFSTMYQFSSKDMFQLYQWVRNGYDLDKLLDVYDFAQDTDCQRDWAYAKAIYDEAQTIKIHGKNWIEGAFNSLTENRGGVLNEGDITAYMNAGITLEEIHSANIMSRKGTKTIQEILDEKISGKAWNEIAQEVYQKEGVTAECFHASASVQEIYADIVMADVTGIDIRELAEKAQQAQQRLYAKNEIIKRTMEKLKLSEKDSEEVLSFAKSKLENVSKQDIKELIDSGFSIRELEENLENANKKGMSLKEYMR